MVLITRFLLEHVEERGLVVVRRKPTRKMQNAMKKGKRLSISWVDPRTKGRWRYFAALDAAPKWRVGYEAEIALDDAVHTEQCAEDTPDKTFIQSSQAIPG